MGMRMKGFIGLNARCSTIGVYLLIDSFYSWPPVSCVMSMLL